MHDDQAMSSMGDPRGIWLLGVDERGPLRCSFDRPVGRLGPVHGLYDTSVSTKAREAEEYVLGSVGGTGTRAAWTTHSVDPHVVRCFGLTLASLLGELASTGAAIVPEPGHAGLGTAGPSVSDAGLCLSLDTRSGNSAAERAGFVAEVKRLLADEPIEPAVSHPVEAAIAAALMKHRAQAPRWVRDLARGQELGRDRADFVHCLAHVDRESVGFWAYQIAGDLLSESDLAVRDAALRALENRGGPYARSKLSAHVELEPDPFLRSYVEDVLRDMAAES